jgi:hypothetical protein
MVRYTRRNYEGAVEAFATCIRLMDEQGWQMENRLTQCYYIQGLAYYALDNCGAAQPLFETALFEMPQILERDREITLQGVTLCETVVENPNSPHPTLTPSEGDGLY